MNQCHLILSTSLLLITLVTGCGSYNAVEEVGYDAPWYVTVVYEDGTRKSEMVEMLAILSQQESSPKAVHVEGVDRRTKEKVLIEIESVLKPNPGSMQVVNKYRQPIEGTY